MKIIIVSPEKQLYAGDVESVSVPGAKGRFEVLNHHAPIISPLTAGEVRCGGRDGQTFIIKGGFIEVAHNEIALCVEV